MDVDIASRADVVRIEIPTDKSTTIYFNGQNHDNCFTFTADEATAILSCFAPFMRQGENVITVNPESILGSYTRSFIIDSAGPSIQVDNVCYLNAADCSLSDSGEVTFDVRFIDPSNVDSVSVWVNTVSYAANVFSGKKASSTFQNCATSLR